MTKVHRKIKAMSRTSLVLCGLKISQVESPPQDIQAILMELTENLSDWKTCSRDAFNIKLGICACSLVLPLQCHFPNLLNSFSLGKRFLSLFVFRLVTLKRLFVSFCISFCSTEWTALAFPFSCAVVFSMLRRFFPSFLSECVCTVSDTQWQGLKSFY